MSSDLAIPLAARGRGLVLAEYSELADDDAGGWLELVRCRYLACLFGAPLWGALFDGDHDADDNDD